MALTSRPLREVTPQEVEDFWRDGVVCLRGVIAQDWLDLAAEAVEAWLRSPECLDFTAYGAEVAR